MTADLIIHNAGQLVTCASGGKPKRGLTLQDAGVIPGGAIAVVDGKITAVGESDDILSNVNADSLIDAGGQVVCPGLVDPHTHIVYGGNRLDEFEQKIADADYLEILGKGGGIISTVRATREANVDTLASGAIRRLDKMLACGTTTCEIKTGYGLDSESELKMLEVIAAVDANHPMRIVPTFLAAHAVPPEFNGRADEYVDAICGEMLPAAWDWYTASKFSRAKIPFFADVFCERNAFDLAQSERVLRTAKALWFGIKAHVDQYSNLGGVRLGIELNAASIDHLDTISDDEIALLAGSDTVGVVIPTENFSAGKTTFANARKMIDSGCAIALSTDYNPGSAPCPSMPMAMAIACRYQKLSPVEAMNASTVNAAFAIGMGTSVGSIEIGKMADVAIFPTNDLREIAYEYGCQVAETIVIGGEIVLGE